ncbi:flagellar hook-basal body complex protein [Aeoliella sp. SH292]|uniref:flagellar hook-basal body complex protein n=1 Tax=Aeoliella sp. SH292 TaxID=3454464 RepID=UPI003F9CD17F
MGLQSALTTALTGLQAAETTIDVVGNNVANASTVGFKESEAIFATQFLQTVSIGGAPNSNQGGTNPRQIGLGVRVAAINPKFTQGTIEISSNPLDVAIQGDGFLIVQSGTGRLYTRNGQLQLNANNEVVTATGQRVLGYGVDDNFNLVTDTLQPLRIPLGQERVAQATQNAFFTGVLNPAVAEGTKPEVVESLVLGRADVAAPEENDTTPDFDISDVVASVVPAPGTATATNAGTGPGAYTVNYRVAFLDANGRESTFSTEFSVDNSGGAGEVDLTGLPAATGNWVDRVIYRSDSTGTDFFRVGNVGSAASTTFTDNVADGSLGPAIDDSVIEPGSYSYYVTFLNSSTGAETRPAPVVGPVGISDVDGGRIRLNFADIDPPADTDFNQMRIYRSNATGVNHRLIDTVAAPGTGTFVNSYVDSTSNADITASPSTHPVVNLDGPPAVPTTKLVDLLVRQGDTYTTPFQPGRLSFSAEKDGVTLDPKYLDVDEDTELLELMNFMEDALGLSATSAIDASNPFPNPNAGVEITGDGRLKITSNFGEENAISVPLTAFKLVPEGAINNETVALNFSSTQAADGPGTSTEFIVYDSLGLPLSVRVTTVLEEKDGNSTTYRWYATSADNEPGSGLSTVIGDGVLVFDQNGDLDPNTIARIAIRRDDTASESPLEIDLDYSSVKSLGEVDALGNFISNLNVSKQDGFPPGVLTDYIISDDGLIQGQFSNGTQRTVGQLMMARFANNAGLRQVGDSMFSIGVNSGEPVLGKPGQEGIGTLTAGAVELSNTDIGQNLIELILASTQYRGGARVISASQDLLDELLALRR